MIRPELPNDAAAIAAVHTAAFGRPTEAELVARLRAAPGFDPRLSLVSLADQRSTDQVVGHILFSPIRVGEGTALALAPLAVLPEQQRRGHGSALIRAGLAACRDAGHATIVVLGHADYYSRFGFEPAERYAICAPFEVPPGVLRVVQLTGADLSIPHGIIDYGPAFEGV